MVEGDICQWHREFSYLSSEGKPDIGRMTFHSPSEVSEDGLDGAYHEVGCLTSMLHMCLLPWNAARLLICRYLPAPSLSH